MAIATFAAGCFWGIEAAYRRIEGVTSTAVGYTGGQTSDPTYKEVCSGRTGHAEAVQVEFDPARVTYEQLLEVFWNIHDPTQVDRQGPDIGSQYRTAIFYHDTGQQAAATDSKAKLESENRFGAPIATEILPAVTFFLAEDYHQQYFEKQSSRRGGYF